MIAGTARRRFPDDVGVDVEVPVNQDVPHTDDVRPGNLRREAPHVFGERLGRLAHDPQVAQKPVLNQLVPLELYFIPAVVIALDSLNSG